MAEITTITTLRDELDRRGFTCRYLLDAWIHELTQTKERRDAAMGSSDLTHVYLHESERHQYAYAHLSGFVTALEVVGTITRKEGSAVISNLIKNTI